MKDEVRLLFHELAGLSRDKRERALARRQIEPEVRAEVESLLHYDSPSTQAFTTCIAEAAGQLLLPSALRCGPYRLVRLLGRGGMGDVYLGERSDGEIQQTVAVKLLSAPAGRPDWRDRFLRERQLLASLSHPSVVRVMDAGHTDHGQPFLVMEYVEGTPIDVFAAQLPVRDRLTLFLRVCEGVSHAHGRLIIHRDLKPSNILVDQSGQPKLLDFGIAKLLAETGNAIQTAERILTPNYASPEQLRGEAQTTATDIYSLGAVLYKLLTGRSPHESDAHTSNAMDVIAGTLEIQAPARMNPEVATDLDCVVRKALRTEPEERYASVEAFGNDIRAFLESRPVQARSSNAWYRTRKFLRRHWAAVAAALLVVASLSVGLHVANRERAIAQRRFSDVRQLGNKLFDIDVQVRDLPGGAKTRQLIVDTALEYLRRLTADVRGDPDLALEVGNAYMRVARVQGVPISATLGQLNQAEQTLRIASGFIESTLKAQPTNRTAMLRAAQIAHDGMILARFSGRDDDAIRLAREAAGWLQKFDVRKGDEPEISAVLNTYYNVADEFARHQAFVEALRFCTRGADLAKIFDRPALAGNFLRVSARVERRRGNLEEALRAIQESVSILDPGTQWITRFGQTTNFVLALVDQGKILGADKFVSLGQPDQAVQSLERAFRMADAFVHRDPNDHYSRGSLAEAGIHMSRILRHSHPRRALEVYDHTLRHLAEVQNDVYLQGYEVNLLSGSTYALCRLDRFDEARRRLDMAFERLKQLKFYPADTIAPGSEASETIQALGDYEAAGGNLSGAMSTYQELLKKIQPAKPGLAPSLEDSVQLSTIYRSAAAIFRRAGQIELADTLQGKRRDLWLQWNRTLPNNSFVLHQVQASNLP